MKNYQILVIGKNEAYIDLLSRLINNFKQCMAFSALSIQEAIHHFNETPIDLILLSNGLTEEEETAIKDFFSFQKNPIKILPHYGGGSGLLKSELQFALKANFED